jgi:hypothetical protein
MFGEAGKQYWYPPGEAVAVAAAVNTNGLYVLTPGELQHVMVTP